MSETLDKMRDLTRRRNALLGQLLEPARAALNAMKDAGMHHSADPLAEVLFQFDALDAEATEFIQANHGPVLAELLKLAREI